MAAHSRVRTHRCERDSGRERAAQPADISTRALSARGDAVGLRALPGRESRPARDHGGHSGRAHGGHHGDVSDQSKRQRAAGTAEAGAGSQSSREPEWREETRNCQPAKARKACSLPHPLALDFAAHSRRCRPSLRQCQYRSGGQPSGRAAFVLAQPTPGESKCPRLPAIACRRYSVEQRVLFEYLRRGRMPMASIPRVSQFRVSLKVNLLSPASAPSSAHDRIIDPYAADVHLRVPLVAARAAIRSRTARLQPLTVAQAIASPLRCGSINCVASLSNPCAVKQRLACAWARHLTPA